MKKWICYLLGAIVLTVAFSDVADARPRRRRARFRFRNNVVRTSVPHRNVFFSATTPQAMAEEKAAYQASNQWCGHPGGGYAGANAEGCGSSPYSAQQALNNCCFTGQRTVAGQAVVKGDNGVWYATKIFW